MNRTPVENVRSTKTSIAEANRESAREGALTLRASAYFRSTF